MPIGDALSAAAGAIFDSWTWTKVYGAEGGKCDYFCLTEKPKECTMDVLDPICQIKFFPTVRSRLVMGTRMELQVQQGGMFFLKLVRATGLQGDRKKGCPSKPIPTATSWLGRC